MVWRGRLSVNPSVYMGLSTKLEDKIRFQLGPSNLVHILLKTRTDPIDFQGHGNMLDIVVNSHSL